MPKFCQIKDWIEAMDIGYILFRTMSCATLRFYSCCQAAGNENSYRHKKPHIRLFQPTMETKHPFQDLESMYNRICPKENPNVVNRNVTKIEITSVSTKCGLSADFVPLIKTLCTARATP